MFMVFRLYNECILSLNHLVLSILLIFIIIWFYYDILVKLSPDFISGFYSILFWFFSCMYFNEFSSEVILYDEGCQWRKRYLHVLHMALVYSTLKILLLYPNFYNITSLSRLSYINFSQYHKIKLNSKIINY